MMKLSTKNKEILLWCGSVLFASVAISGLTLKALVGDTSAFLRLVRTYNAIQSSYFREIDDRAVWDGAAAGMVDALDDKYSQLLLGKEYTSFMDQATGEYGGIGVVVGEDGNGHVLIMAVFPDGGAKTAGVLPGDEIRAIDGETVDTLPLDDIAGKLRGKEGTAVKVTLLRSEETVDCEITRSNVVLPTVQGEMAAEKIGYIHIYSFAKHTPGEFKKEYDRLKEEGMEKLILDLRMNPGGLVDSVVAVADQLLTKGSIVSYQQKNGAKEDFTIEGVDKVIPMVVLIDKNSASSSEILAGAVQDKKEGTIMGETSFGKGTVQVVLQMADEEILKLSVAQYLTAAGRKIDKIGIKPDIPVEQTGRIFDKATDNVLQEAIETLQKE